MERLTRKNWRNLDPWEMCGQDNYCKRGCHEQGGCTNGCIVPRIYARLAAYEELMERWKLRSIEEADHIFQRVNALGGTDLMARYRAIGSIDHLRDLLQAEKEARLVVLPCKVGDMVYEVCNNTDACSGCRNYEWIYGSGESWCTRIDDVDLRSYPNIAERPLCEKQFMEVVEHKPKADWIFNHRNDFGKTVFLAREEAEAALKGGEG